MSDLLLGTWSTHNTFSWLLQTQHVSRKQSHMKTMKRESHDHETQFPKEVFSIYSSTINSIRGRGRICFFLTSKMKHFFSLVRLDQLIIYGIFKCWRQLECYKWRKGKSHAINCPDSKTFIGVVLRVRGRVWFDFDIKVKTESPINLEEVQTSTLLINEYLIHIRSTLPESSSVLLRSPRMLFNGVS